MLQISIYRHGHQKAQVKSGMKLYGADFGQRHEMPHMYRCSVIYLKHDGDDEAHVGEAFSRIGFSDRETSADSLPELQSGPSWNARVPQPTSGSARCSVKVQIYLVQISCDNS